MPLQKKKSLFLNWLFKRATLNCFIDCICHTIGHHVVKVSATESHIYCLMMGPTGQQSHTFKHWSQWLAKKKPWWFVNDWGTCWGEEPAARVLFLSVAVSSESIQAWEKEPQIVGISESLVRGNTRNQPNWPLTWLHSFIEKNCSMHKCVSLLEHAAVKF